MTAKDLKADDLFSWNICGVRTANEVRKNVYRRINRHKDRQDALRKQSGGAVMA